MRQVYKLVNRYRLSDGLVTNLAPGCPTGGKGKSRIAPEIEKLISESIEHLLTRQKRSQAAVEREIWMRCKQSASSSVAQYNTCTHQEARSENDCSEKAGCDAARSLHSAAGKSPEPNGPLDIRPNGSHAGGFDRSRRVLAPANWSPIPDHGNRYFHAMYCWHAADAGSTSATSVGLCLTHTVTDKSCWLSGLGITDMDLAYAWQTQKDHLGQRIGIRRVTPSSAAANSMA